MAKRARSKVPSENHLANEKSPYLLQHADNPVDWYPWGDEAFERARQEDRPIFLSVGYSTCHWCHVMAHESFEDPKVATLMNDTFVNIKVDREERPDIDSIYMSVCQMMTGSGGWPLTIVMTPEGKPFFAGTYFPRTGRFGRAGMLELVPKLAELWTDRREEVNGSAIEITGALSRQAEGSVGAELETRHLDTAAFQLNQRFDEDHGGFGEAPKFPSPHNLTYLLRYWLRADDDWSKEMVVRTLRGLRMGGIYDQVGMGFHRYSTDDAWLVPHYEKMLYDQAGLLMAYTEAFQATGDPLLRSTAEEIVEYVLRDMTSPEGAFFSAEDADSEGVEGKFYLWTLPELREVLGDEDGEMAAAVFNARTDGNFRDEATGKSQGTNILHLTRSMEELSASLEMATDDLEGRVGSIRERLLEARSHRVRPHLDDKVLTDWNGMMIAALAKAGSALGRPDMVEAAGRAATFVMDNLRRDDGRLLHRYRDGEAAIEGHLDDYAFMVWGMLDLYEATFEPSYLRTAVELNRTMMEHFWDGTSWGLYLTPDDGEELLVRPKEVYDGAMPSGNSVAMLNLLRLSHLTGGPGLAKRASELGAAFSGDVGRMPVGFTQLMSALDMAISGVREVVIVGDPLSPDTKAMVEAIRRVFSPNTVVLFKDPAEGDGGIVGIAPFLIEHHVVDGRATAYVCQDHFCNRPTNDVDVMLEELTG
jgi:uncharacterized protein YyaL (SSP411 family)